MGNFDYRVAIFQRMGLTEAAARIATIGRGRYEADVRRELDGDPSATPLAEAARGEVATDAALVEAIAEVASAAKDAFGKTDEQARVYAVQLCESALAKRDARSVRLYAQTLRDVYLRPRVAR